MLPCDLGNVFKQYFTEIYKNKYFYLQTAQPNNFKCTYANGEFYSNIIYKHSKHNQPYDVAILDVPDSIPDTNFTFCEITPAKTGSNINLYGLIFKL